MGKGAIKTGSTKILILDEYPILAHGLSLLLKNVSGYYVAGTAVNTEKAMKIYEQEKPHLVIMEVQLKNENGMELIQKLKEINPEIVILVFSVLNERYYAERYLRLGVRGFIMKTAPAETVLEAVKTVMSGKVYLSENERDRIFEAVAVNSIKGVKKDWASSIRKLSEKELLIFSMLGNGIGTIEIASKLGVSTKTIDTHKEHIKTKLHCKSSQEMRQFAIEWTRNSISL